MKSNHYGIEKVFYDSTSQLPGLKYGSVARTLVSTGQCRPNCVHELQNMQNCVDSSYYFCLQCTAHQLCHCSLQNC